MFSTLAEYDGRVIADSTKGELAARCGGTSMNFVAVNLAHDIIKGGARSRMRGPKTRGSTMRTNGDKPEYTQGL
jgi:hypothetical protein